jgi:pyruvate/2-oxoglutarate/acetoin dehydrogenase E1 component
MTRLSYLKAVNAAIREEMERDPKVFVMGEDVRHNLTGAYGGLPELFGLDRIRNTPITEAGFVGAAAGASMVGMRPIVDMLIAPFMYCAFDQFVSIMAKSTYLYGGQAQLPITVRAPMMYRGGMAAQHSDRPIATFMTIPGLKIMSPTTSRDAKGLWKTAIRDNDPVISFEDNHLWGKRDEVPDEEYLIPFGVADIKGEGSDVTIVAIAGAVILAMEARDRLATRGISAEVLDPRTLVPLDTEAILRSVRKTGRLVVADPCHETCSVASEISAMVAERAFDSLRGPIVRVTTPQIHIPFSPPLETPLYPSADRIEVAAMRLLGRSEQLVGKPA